MTHFTCKFVIRSITIREQILSGFCFQCAACLLTQTGSSFHCPVSLLAVLQHVTEIFPVQAHMFIVRAALCLLICRCLFVLWKRVCLLLRGCDITCLSGETLPQMAADEWNNWGRMHTLRLLQTDRHDAHTHSSWLIRQQKSQSYSVIARV